jgi:hypothetical protein
MGLRQSENRCECQSLLEQLREIRELRECVQNLEAKAAKQADEFSWRRTNLSRRLKLTPSVGPRGPVC